MVEKFWRGYQRGLETVLSYDTFHGLIKSFNHCHNRNGATTTDLFFPFITYFHQKKIHCICSFRHYLVISLVKIHGEKFLTFSEMRITMSNYKLEPGKEGREKIINVPGLCWPTNLPRKPFSKRTNTVSLPHACNLFRSPDSPNRKSMSRRTVSNSSNNISASSMVSIYFITLNEICDLSIPRSYPFQTPKSSTFDMSSLLSAHVWTCAFGVGVS